MYALPTTYLGDARGHTGVSKGNLTMKWNYGI